MIRWRILLAILAAIASAVWPAIVWLVDAWLKM